MTTIDEHFTLEEFACHDGTPYPDEWVASRLKPLCDVLEIIRAKLNYPIHILSGYRTEAHNEALRDADGSGSGVAKNSQHIQGMAADIAVSNYAPKDVHAAILELDKAGLIKIGGLGKYQGWVHVDIRERPADGHLAQWNGPGVV